MNYNHYNCPSAVTEERLASIVCASVNESVKDYLSEVTEYVACCQKTIGENQEIIDELTSERDALLQQVAELKECLNAIYTGKVGSVKNIYHYAAGSVHNDNRNMVSIYEEDKKKLIN